MLRTDIVTEGPYWMRTGQVTAHQTSQTVLEPDVRRQRAIFYNTDDDMSAFLMVNGAAARDTGVVVPPGESREVVDTHAIAIISETATPAVNEVQTATITGSPTGGTITWTFGGQSTAALARNVATATLQAAMEGLSTIGAGNIAVGGTPGSAYTFTFQGDLAGQDVAMITQTNSLSGGSSPDVAIAETTKGAAAVGSAVVGYQEIYT